MMPGQTPLRMLIYIKSKFRLAFVFTLTSLAAFSQDPDFFKPDSVRKKIEAVQITENLKVDGLLNEPEWALAKTSSRFVQIEPHQGKAANFQTDLKVLYNR